MTRSRSHWKLSLAAVSACVVIAGCGAGPRPVEVTEPWTSGDERALGIEDASAATGDSSEGVTVSDAAPPAQ